MARRKRPARGAAPGIDHPRALVKAWEDIRAIREAKKHLTYKDLSEITGLSRACLYCICKHKTYKEPTK